MHIKKILVFKIFFVIFVDDLVVGQGLNYKIAVPEFICDKNGSVREIQSDMTTIRFLGKDASALSYRFSVNYQRIGSSCRNKQRCTLIAWKLVREFENYLKSYPSSENGLIEFNNTMLMPGLKYILKITVENNGSTVEEKQMNLDFVDEDVKKSIEKPLASILLLGSDLAVAYMTYVINAETTICSNITDYYFKWKLLDETNTEVDNIRDKSAELRIPPNTFQASKIYTISCDLVDASNEVSIAKGSQSVSVQQRGLLVHLPVENMMAKINAPLTIKAYIADLDNQDGEAKISWTCTDGNNNECDANSDTNELHIENGFSTLGKYKISIEVSKGDFTETKSCDISIIEDSPSINIDSVETPVSPSNGLEIRADVDELRAFCSLQWQSVKEDGYEFLDLNTVPGNVNDLFNVTLREDLFLNELEEFSNNTVSKRYNLIIPPPQGSWEGLKGDVRYLFRLVISCPSTLDDYDNNEATINSMNDLAEPILGEAVITFADVSIDTNSGPALKPLMVNPMEGQALTTSFNFKTQKAEDKPEEFPISYNFGYVLGDMDVFFCSMTDVINTEGILPYARDGVQTFLKACDNFNSCTKIFGPVIKTTLSSDVNSDVEKVLHTFKENLNTDDFHKAFIFALSVLITYKELNNDVVLDEAQGYFSREVNRKIMELIESTNKDDYWSSTANKLIKNISEFNSELSFAEEVLNNLVKLRSEISDITELSENLIAPGRKLLSTQTLNARIKQNVNLEDIKSYLQVSELIITNSVDKEKVELEKEHLRKKLHHYMEKLCTGLYIQEQKTQLEIKTFIATVEKLDRNAFLHYTTIPFDGNSWQLNVKIKLNGPFTKMKENHKLCLGRASFKNYLEKTGMVHLAEIYEANQQQISLDGLGSDIYLPIDAEEITRKTPKCTVWNNEWKNSCTFLKITSQFAHCSCNSLGYYYLDYELNNTTSTSLTSLLTTSTTFKISAPVATTTSTSTLSSTLPIDTSAISRVLTAFTNEISLTIETTTEKSDNKESSTVLGEQSQESFTKNSDNNSYEFISYIFIAMSLVGIGILCIILKRITAKEDEHILLDDLDSPKYAALYNEELLTGCT